MSHAITVCSTSLTSVHTQNQLRLCATPQLQRFKPRFTVDSYCQRSVPLLVALCSETFPRLLRRPTTLHSTKVCVFLQIFSSRAPSQCHLFTAPITLLTVNTIYCRHRFLSTRILSTACIQIMARHACQPPPHCQPPTHCQVWAVPLCTVYTATTPPTSLTIHFYHCQCPHTDND